MVREAYSPKQTKTYFPRSGGSGLGLFISRRLTEMHGGAIGFSSQAGVGSTFAFYVKSRRSVLTRRQSEINSAAVDLTIRAQASVMSSRSRGDKDNSPVRLVYSEVAAADLHVLIVEDNLVNQRVLAKQLKNIGMKVSVANHGGEALDHLRTTNYCVKDGTHINRLSLILMDWEMPVSKPSISYMAFPDTMNYHTGNGWTDLRAPHPRTPERGCRT
jgi:CheY-like chemotaxis protein